jgi:hypothetical protein
VIQLAFVVIAIIVAFYVTQSMLGSVQEAPLSVEYLEFVNFTTSRDAHMNWQVSVNIANPGNSTLILEKVLVNSMEVSEYSAESPSEIVATLTTDFAEETDLKSGEMRSITIWVGGQFGFFNSGSILDIKFESSAGNEFVKTLILP